MTSPAIHLCRICEEPTRQQRINSDDGVVVVSEHCVCGFIESFTLRFTPSRESATQAPMGNLPNRTAARSFGDRAALSGEAA